MPTNTSIKELEALITDARTAYYNSDEPTMSDAEFDALCDELTKLDPNNKALTAIGAPPSSEWVKVKHLAPMGSLNKVNTPEDMSSWVNDKLGGREVVVVEKLDGLSICCQYQDGKLVHAPLRGGGDEGEDILANVVKMHGVVKKLKSKFNGTIRGEIVLTKTDHKKHFPSYANPRNAASGLCRRFDGEGSEHLTIMAYDVIGDEDFAKEEEKFVFLKKNGFLVPNYLVCKNANDINALWQLYQDKTRASLDYEIDGLVSSCCDLVFQRSLGEHDMRPKGKLAFKFLNQFIKTTVKEIKWDVGGSGRVCPVCWFEPVSILGSTIEKASVYNVAYIKKLGIGAGATVMVCKAGEIIPRVEKVIKPAKEVASPPDFCPSCDTKIIVQGEYLICPNRDCKPQVVGRVARWVGELNILELGDTLIEKLVETGLVKDPSDLYTLTVDSLSKIERMGEKSALNVFNSIWGRNPVPLELFLGSLSIPFIGSSMISMLIAAGHDTLDKLQAMKQSDIEKVKGYGSGSVKASALFGGLKDNEGLITALLKNGVEIKEKVMGALTGKVFVFTGKSSLPRKNLEQLVVDNGGTVKSSVGSGVTHLVLADKNSQSTKAVKARSLGTECISEEDFMEMVGLDWTE